MRQPWCRALPVVTVPQGEIPKRLTIVWPYYENPAFLRAQVATWWDWPGDLQAAVSAIVVDDGSPVPAELPPSLPFPVRLFRIDVDIRWNWLAARNIGAHHAADGWLLLTDMDHVVPAPTLRAIVYGQHDPAVVYAFARQEHTGAAVTPHSASFLMTRAMFWRIGGYDERLSGFYGTDGVYRRRLLASAPVRVQADPLIRHEYVLDSSTVRYGRKEPQDAQMRRRLATLTGRPKTLTFPYHEVQP